MDQKMLSEEFGIAMLDGEELILEVQPDGFVRFVMVNGLMSIIAIPLLPLMYLYAIIAKRRYRYWLTNRRVILASGFIGFKVRCIPLERVSDVALSNTLPEILARVQSVNVRDMTGEAETGKSFLAIENAPAVQRRVLEEVQRVNSRRQAV